MDKLLNPPLPGAINLKLMNLHEILMQYGTVHIAYSGGLDSRFLAYTAYKLGCTVQLYHFQGPHVSQAESLDAQSWAKQYYLDLTCIDSNPLTLEAVHTNQKDRCYHCKKSIFTQLREILPQAIICDGTNFSDLSQYRPGARALKELDIHSPLAQAELTKANIRQLAHYTGMDNPDQLARPCLLTRFPYDFPITIEDLLEMAQAELTVQEALQTCYPHQKIDFRLRRDPHLLAQINLPDDPQAEANLRQLLTMPIHKTSILSGYFDAK